MGVEAIIVVIIVTTTFVAIIVVEFPTIGLPVLGRGLASGLFASKNIEDFIEHGFALLVWIRSSTKI